MPEESARMSGEAKITEYRLRLIEESLSEIRTAIKGIHDSLRTLATLEVRHEQTREALGRAFSALERLESRVGAIEEAMPLLQLTSKWIRAGVVSLAGLVIIGAIKIVFGL